MKILVVTPTRGRSPWLSETIATVSAYAPGAQHVLVAPSDSIADLQRRFPPLTISPEPAGGGGMYAAINAGAASSADWDAITYINDDDLLCPGFAAVVEAMRDTDLRRVPLFAYGRVALIDGKGRRVGAIPISSHPASNRLLYAQQIEPVYQHGTLFSYGAWHELGGCDAGLRLCGDSDLLARACLAAIPARAVHAQVASFRLHPVQLSQSRAAMHAERAAVDAKLQLVASRIGLRHTFARWWFRIANVSVYAERLARHGWKTFDEVLSAGGAAPPTNGAH